ncbi:dihydroneopterin aldolase [Sphaerotilus mobilis]|nr:dihydroneopterin aldolase [Sphaerotilus mobilis]
MTTHPSPTADTGTDALDLIFIEGYTGETVIGIHPSEFHRTQPLVIDVHAGVPHADACDSDQIVDTIDYGVVRDRLDALMLDHGVTLLEALAERIAQMLLVDFGAAWVRVKVVKPRKFDNVQAVGVMIERRRHTSRPQGTASAGTQTGAQVLRWIGAGTVPQGH